MNETELRRQRAHWQQKLEAIKRDVAQGLDADAKERAVQLENADVLNEIARVCQAEIAAIDEKLRRLNTQ